MEVSLSNDHRSRSTGGQGSVFLSYSSRDKPLVDAMNDIILATGKMTFQDKRSIPVGADWRVTVTTNIDDCESMFVFWCRHARRSREVEREYSLALDKKKTVVPIKLDGSSLPARLSRIQGLSNPLYRWWHRLGIVQRLWWRAGLVLLLAWGAGTALT